MFKRIKNHFSKQNRRIIVAGSGPSLATIEYRRLPDDCPIWRVNDFFMEQKYFLGRRVDAVFNGGGDDRITERYQKLCDLCAGNIYDIDLNHLYADHAVEQLPQITNNFAAIRDADSELWAELQEQSDKNDAHMLNGVGAIVWAILCGYRKIYIAGIDCDYESGPQYAYAAAKTSAKKLKWVKSYHPTNLQWDTIRRYQDKYRVKIYSLSRRSPARKFFPLAPLGRIRKYVPAPKEK